LYGHVYGKLKKSGVLNIIERLQIPNILEICYLNNLLWKYVKKYISIQASICLYHLSLSISIILLTMYPFVSIFSSPELKAQVSYSDRLLSVVRLSVCKLLYFRLLLQNRWANFNQTWYKSSLWKGDSSLFKWRGLSLSKGR
jgi:hypothetical protein